MAVLNYSSFMTLLLEHYSYEIEKETLARNLLEATIRPELHAGLTSTYLSQLLTKKRNVTKDIQSEFTSSKVKAKCHDYFKDVIIPDLSESLFPDLLDKLVLLINDDTTILKTKKNSLLMLSSTGNYPKYFSELFVYAIQKENKGIVTSVGVDDIELLQQVDMKCPLCPAHTPLVEHKSSKPFFRYSITKIYPEITDNIDENEFSAVHPKPVDVNDQSNKICLCDNCSADYLFHPDIRTYDRLYRIKRASLRHGDLRRASDVYPIEEGITEILNRLRETNIDSDDYSVFRLKPLAVVKKIHPENHTLIKAIKDDNEAYYFFIRDYLSTQDQYKNTFKKIALEIQLCFESLSEQTEDQDEIYNTLIDWIMTKLSLDSRLKTSAHIIISFFVQNCEVFHEIS